MTVLIYHIYLQKVLLLLLQVVVGEHHSPGWVVETAWMDGRLVEEGELDQRQQKMEDEKMGGEEGLKKEEEEVVPS